MRILTLSQLSLSGSSGIAEVKVPLWFADGTYLGTTSTAGLYLQDGAGSGSTTNTGSAVKLFTLSSTWPSNQQCAFETTMYSGNASATATAWLYDITAGQALPSVSTVSTTATVIRSAKFPMTPGHTYGVVWSSSTTSYNVYMIDASLIIFP